MSIEQLVLLVTAGIAVIHLYLAHKGHRTIEEIAALLRRFARR